LPAVRFLGRRIKNEQPQFSMLISVMSPPQKRAYSLHSGSPCRPARFLCQVGDIESN
jgi:hypothetical protein